MLKKIIICSALTLVTLSSAIAGRTPLKEVGEFELKLVKKISNSNLYNKTFGRRAKNLDPDTYLNLAIAHLQEKKGKKSIDKSHKYFTRSLAVANDEKTDIVKKKMSEAFYAQPTPVYPSEAWIELYQKTIDESQDAERFYNLSQIYACSQLDNRGELFLQNLRKAAHLGHAKARYKLASDYEKSGDLKRAYQWYRCSARKGNVNAQIRISDMYADGIGVEQNLVKAQTWKRRATKGLLESINSARGLILDAAISGTMHQREVSGNIMRFEEMRLEEMLSENITNLQAAYLDLIMLYNKSAEINKDKALKFQKLAERTWTKLDNFIAEEQEILNS